MAEKEPEKGVARIPLPLLVALVLVVFAVLLVATGGHIPLPTLGGPSTATSAPAPAPTGQSWDSALVDLTLALTARLLVAVPLLLAVVGFLHLTHFWKHHARPLFISIAIGTGVLLLVPVLIVLLPHILQFRDHIVSELIH